VFLRTAAGEDVRLGGVHGDAADVVRVGLEHVHPLQGVVVEHADLHVVLRWCEGGREGGEQFDEQYDILSFQNIFHCGQKRQTC